MLVNENIDKTHVLKEVKRNQYGYGLLIESDGYINVSDDLHKMLTESLATSGTAEFKVPYPFRIPAIFQKYGVENANGRIYPKEVLLEQVELYQQKIKERRSFGELNHPQDTVIDGERISHLITELHWEGATLVGELELLISPGYMKQGIISCVADKVANDILFHKIKVGVSSRGIGSVKQIGSKAIVEKDFELVCWDIVTDPSTPGAWIGKSPDELKIYVENNRNNENLLNKLDKLLIN